MSTNAIEVLEARFAKREYPPYHSSAWWNMVWAEHEARLDAAYCAVDWSRMIRFPDEYPPPAATPWEVTPATGLRAE